MAIIKCKMCGGDLEISDDKSIAECEYCGTRQTVPTVNSEKKMTLFSRANRLRLANEFDKASTIYEAIVAEFPDEGEAYWGLILCRYGVEYVDDPATGKKVPTCHRSSFGSIMEDTDFEQAIENADAVARKVYREEAEAIEEIRQGILEISAKEEPYDIFICYKETDEDGNRTIDSVIAQDVYEVLTEKGYRVFFSRITLEDKLGSEYEPYIFAALNSAKVMLAFGTDYEYFNAVWVKNEWSRFLALIATGQKKTLIPCYKDIDAYDMPKEFARLQSQDMGKVGAIQDLVRGIEKIIPRQQTKQQANQQEKEGYSEADQVALRQINRGLLYLEDESWEEAYNSFEDAYYDSDSDETSSASHIGKICAKLEISSVDEFEKEYPPLPERTDYDTFACAVETKAGYVMLSREDWSAAQEFFDEALKVNPEYALAYIGKMMVSNKISNESDVADSFFGRNQDIYEDKNYQKALRFADAVLRERLERFAKSQYSVDSETVEILHQIREKIKPFCNLLIASGNNTFALTSYGTVYATGENRDGQCDTSGWHEIKSIAVGSYHIAGLKKDGSVVAVGAKNEFSNRGQCQTDRWSDIKQIAVSSVATVGLKSNGGFVVCGYAIENKNHMPSSVSEYAVGVAKNIIGQIVIPKITNYKAVYLGPDDIYGLLSDKRVETINSYNACKNWYGIIDIATSPLANHVVGLSETGTCYARGKNKYGECNVTDWKDIVAVAIGGGSFGQFTVGLRSNGTVVVVGDNHSGQCRTSSWRNIVAIAAGEYHTVGLKSDGTVVAVGGNDEKDGDNGYKRNYGQCDTSDWRDIIAISAGAYHTVGLKIDGTVVAVGSNEQGQCDTKDWSEIGIANTQKEQERSIAESYRLRLVTLKAELSPRNEEMKHLRTNLKYNFDSLSVCLNCGKKHLGVVKKCKVCGAFFESGVGSRGIKYRRYYLTSQGIDCQIFQDGFLDLITRGTDGKQKKRRITETDNYFEYYVDSAGNQDSDIMAITPDNRFCIIPKEKTGLHQVLCADGSSHFYYNGKQQIAQVVYPGGDFTLEGCDEPILKHLNAEHKDETFLTESSGYILCPNCKKENKVAAKFCKHCGASMQISDVLKCPNCGSELKIGKKFCPMCGAKVDNRE